ncbi:MAG: hypothetical protein LDL39_10170, partial [Magnetospirillum sp.]|nr:hypothetical protein [Magnetospirillum sp.]
PRPTLPSPPISGITGTRDSTSERDQSGEQVRSQQHDDWENLKVDNWVGPKTRTAFGRVLQNEDADKFTTAFGRGLGLL